MTPLYAALPALVLFAVPAAAGVGEEEDGDGAYLELGGGLASISEIDVVAGSADFESGYSLSALLGYRWTEACDACFDLALELEVYYANVGFDDTLLVPGSSQTDYLAHGGVLLGGVLDWPVTRSINFYVGAAGGIATSMTLESKGDASSSVDLEDDSAFVIQGKAGVRYAMAENLSWYLQYKHLMSEEVTASDSFLDQSFDFEIQQDAVEIGMRWDL